ncbi:MAG: PepSY domain-containing protein [Candidatus Eremiobacteraeota bacterium]|nr:PepSY domain-containing protein [Candidatus Eremiobacteraeota bacterium]
MKTFLVFALAAAIAAPVAVSATSLKGSQYLPQAKVSLAQARASALKAAHGIIVDQELEKERGGLRYSFDVKVGKTVHEVGVDAITGKVLENSVDTGND